VRQAASVSSINALKEFKRALAGFAAVINTALGEAQSDLQRTTWWVQEDRVTHWQAQKRKRTTQLSQAKSELFRAQVASPDDRVPATLERKAVDQAQQRLNEAETKLANIKRWSRLLEREVILYKGHCQQLSRAIDGDVPAALHRLDKMVSALEKYVRIAAPRTDSDAIDHEVRS
jgi:hypothetical protein